MTRGDGDDLAMQAELNDLCAFLIEHEPVTGAELSMPGLRLRLSRSPTAPIQVMFEPMLYFVLQGAKRLTVGGRTIEYRGGSLLVMSVDLPATGQVTEASTQAPYLALEVLLDPLKVAALLLDLPARVEPDVEGFSIDTLPVSILDPLRRLIRLLEAPEDVAILAPMIEREILYRVLRGPQGAMLRQLGSPESRLWQISRTIEWMRQHVAEPLRIGLLAKLAGMSDTSYHRHFKAVTAMTPLAYHKQIKLQEARRRLIAEPRQAAQIAASVGYESASQFSREYKRQFGSPPARDADRVRRTCR